VIAEWFGASWQTIGFVVLGTVSMYLTLFVAVRLAGRRTIAQLSAFDVLITVALGTLLSSTVVSPEPSYAAATTAVVTLLALQVIVAALRRRSRLAQRILEFEPEVVVRDGRVHLPTGLASSQLSEGELRSRLRQHGIFDDEPLAIVVLEPSGRISVQRRLEPGSTLLPGENDRDPS
jgi:uncharacterized membrane protein YcaP (DUF421 family)